MSTRRPSPKGRKQGRGRPADYLEALEANKPKRGRKRTPDIHQGRLAKIDAELARRRRSQRLKLIQERLDLEAELERPSRQESTCPGSRPTSSTLASAYSSRKGITYAAWREVGVAPAVLKKAGISRDGA